MYQAQLQLYVRIIRCVSFYQLVRCVPRLLFGVALTRTKPMLQIGCVICAICMQASYTRQGSIHVASFECNLARVPRIPCFGV